jgi:hypothetical protein
MTLLEQMLKHHWNNLVRIYFVAQGEMARIEQILTSLEQKEEDVVRTNAFLTKCG